MDGDGLGGYWQEMGWILGFVLVLSIWVSRCEKAVLRLSMEVLL